MQNFSFELVLEIMIRPPNPIASILFVLLCYAVLFYVFIVMLCDAIICYVFPLGNGVVCRVMLCCVLLCYVMVC